MQIGIKLKESRLKKEMTQDDVAKILNISRSTISSWEVGRSYPDLKSLVSLSNLYEVSLDRLLREDADMIEKLNFDAMLKRKIRVILNIISIVMFWIIIIFPQLNPYLCIPIILFIVLEHFIFSQPNTKFCFMNFIDLFEIMFFMSSVYIVPSYLKEFNLVIRLVIGIAITALVIYERKKSPKNATTNKG